MRIGCGDRFRGCRGRSRQVLAAGDLIRRAVKTLRVTRIRSGGCDGQYGLEVAWMQLKDDQPPALSVIRGLTYFEECQVFNRWFLPTYQASFRWTGNRSDAEDATTWVFMNAVGTVHLPELVSVVDDIVADATLEAASRHWCDRYGVVRLRCAEIHAFEAGPCAPRAPAPATHLPAAVAGNNLPTARFVRSLEESFEAHRMTRSRRYVTNLRIWSA